MSTPQKLDGRGPLPLIVSVTGHRDLRPEDIAALEGMVRTIVADTAARYPHSPLCRIRADRRPRPPIKIGAREADKQDL